MRAKPSGHAREPVARRLHEPNVLLQVPEHERFVRLVVNFSVQQS